MKYLLTIFTFMVITAQTETQAQAQAQAQAEDNSSMEIPVEIVADSLELQQEQGYATFTGNVQISQEDMRLGAGVIKVYFTADNIKGGVSGDEVSSSIGKIVANENVTIVYNGDTATGETAIYNPVDNTILLQGNVVMVRDGNVLKGSKLIYNMSNKSMKLDGENGGRVKASFSLPSKK